MCLNSPLYCIRFSLLLDVCSLTTWKTLDQERFIHTRMHASWSVGKQTESYCLSKIFKVKSAWMNVVFIIDFSVNFSLALHSETVIRSTVIDKNANHNQNLAAYIEWLFSSFIPALSEMINANARNSILSIRQEKRTQQLNEAAASSGCGIGIEKNSIYSLFCLFLFTHISCCGIVRCWSKVCVNMHCTSFNNIGNSTAIDASAMAVWMSLHNNSDVMIYCFHFAIASPCLPLRAFVRDITNDSISSIFGLSRKMQLARWKSLAFMNFTNERLYTSKALKFWRRSDSNHNRCFLFIKYQLVGLWVNECRLLFLTSFLFTKMGKWSIHAS